MLPCFESFEACLVFVLVLHLGGVGVDGLPDEFGANLYLGCLLEGGRLQLAGVGERGFKELPVDEVAALKQGGERGLEDVLELLITQDRHLDRVRRAVFVVALPDHGFAGIGGMSSFRSVCVAAVGAIYFAGKAAFASATAARIEFGLGKLPRLWINDRVMRTSHIVLGHLALVDLFGFGEEINGECLSQQGFALVFLVRQNGLDGGVAPTVLATWSEHTISIKSSSDLRNAHAL